jgi:predicted RNA-binding protein Jag
MQEQVSSLLMAFFQGLGIAYTDIQIRLEGQDAFIDIQTPDSALLIGMHGKNIEAFQHLLSRMIEKIVWKFVHVQLEVNDYMKAKDERLFRFLDTKIAFVTSTGKSSKIPNLNAQERKKAHNYIAVKEIAGLTTKSEGTPEDRVLILEYTGPLISISSHPQAQTSSHDDLSEDGVGI